MFILFTILLISFEFTELKVCTSVDVRNTPDRISEYKDCRVIEGHLQIVLMEKSDDVTDYLNKSFTNLYEITDYLIVYRVLGLPSLDIVFPKLASIKGEKLFLGYALVLYELADLDKIGLSNLLSVGRGGVKIGNCPNLCYVDTVDWNIIGVSHVSYDRSSICDYEFCPIHCGGSCWSDYQCQKMEKSQCHPSCIGCTKINSSKDCILCKYFNNSGNCVQSCPESKLTDNDSSKCITVFECISKKWSIFNTTCIKQCPDLFERNSEGKCVQTDKKVCDGMELNTHFDINQLIGCTDINGPLEISLCGYIDHYDLERALGKIVSISDYLKIARSSTITTLSFFKNLQIIKGEKLWSKYYSLFIVENQNLQTLFKDSMNVVIKKGEALFQNNPYLCDKEINKTKTNITRSKNGYEISCELIDIKIQISENNSKNITLTWERPTTNLSDILGYTINYIKVTEHFDPYTVKDGFVDKDGIPYEDNWHSNFTTNNTICLKKLQPFTRYSYYIITYLHSTTKHLQSRTYFFKTATGDPSEPVEFEVHSQTVDITTLRWRRPYYINGNLSHYKLAIYLLEDYIPMIRQRNYCLHPFKEDNCSCPEENQQQTIHSIFSEDKICIGNGDPNCNSKIYYTVNENQDVKNHEIQKRALFRNKLEYVQEYVINASKMGEILYMVHSLKHFTLYSFFLKACNRDEKNEDHYCGGSEMISHRTMKVRSADSIDSITVTFDNDDVLLNWTKPKYPNSVILNYKIEYQRMPVNVSFFKCVTSQKFEANGYKFKLTGLNPGKYSVRVRAVSLAGSGYASHWELFEITENTTSNWGSWVLGVLGFIVVGVIVFAIWKKYQITQEMEMDRIMIARIRAENNFEEDEWRLDDETVEIVREMGQNSIGMLYRT